MQWTPLPSLRGRKTRRESDEVPAYFINSEVDARVGNDAQETGEEAPVEAAQALGRIDREGGVYQAPVLPGLAQREPRLQDL